MAVAKYNDYLRDILKNLECILILDTAADYLGLTNGGYRPVANILVKESTGLDGVKEKVVDDFAKFDYMDINGLKCTTINQTIIDLLQNNVDDQIITECLANYYDINGESFDGLKIPRHIQKNFQMYCQWAREYYEE